MRKTLIAVVLLAACAKNDAAKTDTTAATQAGGATTPAAPAAPAKLTPADLAGTYKGESKPEGKDSVVGKWTSIMVNDSTSKIAFEGTKDTVTYSVRFDADSFIGTSKPYIDPSLPKGAPKEVVMRLNAAVREALADPAVRQRLVELGQDIPPTDQQTPEALYAYHKAEIEKWWPIIKAAGIKAEQ